MKFSLALLLTSVFGLSAVAVEVTIKIPNLKNTNGLVYYSICSSEDCWKEQMDSSKRPHDKMTPDELANANQLEDPPVDSKSVKASMFVEGYKVELPPGKYAFKFNHDDDGNGKVNIARICWGHPIPSEDFGYTMNDPGAAVPTGRAPYFEETAVEVDDNNKIVKLRTIYMKTPQAMFCGTPTERK